MKIIKYLLCFALSAILLAGTCGCSAFRNEVPTVPEIQEIFDRDRDLLLLIKDYFINADYAELYIDEDCETARAGLNDSVHIDDVTVVSALQHLKERGYRFFSKRGNTICFGIWARFRDVGCGIAFSMDGEAISVQYLTEAVPLSEDGWYYYVDDFNEWRAANST